MKDQYQLRACFIGSLSPAFAFDFLDQLNKNNIWQFIICGTGSEFDSLTEKYRDCKNIIFPGWINFAQATYLTSVSDVALAPYRSEKSFEISIPNKIYDYLRAGLPILSSLRGETEKLLANHSLGFTYQSVDEFLLLLKRIENSDIRVRTEAKERGQRLSATDFSFTSVYGGYISHLENLAELSKY